MGNGEFGRDAGVSGLFGLTRVEWEEALDDGRDIGRLVGVKNKKGTPETSSRCLCIRSRTCCSNISESSTPKFVWRSSLSLSSCSSPRRVTTFVTTEVLMRVDSSLSLFS